MAASGEGEANIVRGPNKRRFKPPNTLDEVLDIVDNFYFEQGYSRELVTKFIGGLLYNSNISQDEKEKIISEVITYRKVYEGKIDDAIRYNAFPVLVDRLLRMKIIDEGPLSYLPAGVMRKIEYLLVIEHLSRSGNGEYNENNQKTGNIIFFTIITESIYGLSYWGIAKW